jgi:imidazolonepropionase-like amidohydrolase
VASADAIVIADITVVSPGEPGTREHQTVVIRDGRIEDMLPADSAPRIRHATVVDGRQKFLTPGLVDAHAHVHVRSDLERYLVHGVTSVREMWGLPRELRWRDEIRSGRMAGPNMVVASTYFWMNGPSLTKHVEPKDPATARALVRQAAADGYDLIKVIAIPDMDVLRAIVDEAGKAGLRVSGHYPARSVPVEEMLGVGMWSFEHADEFSSIAFARDSFEGHMRAIARELRSRDIGITTILTPARKYLEIDAKGKDFYSPEARLDILERLGPYHFQDASTTIDNVIAAAGKYVRQWREGTALALRAAKTFADEGVALGIGTEGIGPFLTVDGVGVHDEMSLLAEAGLTNEQVLKVATVNGAHLLGFEGRKGYIRRGYDADLLILSANPIDDLAALRTPEGVFVMGRYYARQDLDFFARIY